MTSEFVEGKETGVEMIMRKRLTNRVITAAPNETPETVGLSGDDFGGGGERSLGETIDEGGDGKETSDGGPEKIERPVSAPQQFKRSAKEEEEGHWDPSVEDFDREKSRKEGTDETAAVGQILERGEEGILAPSLIGEIEGTREAETTEMGKIATHIVKAMGVEKEKEAATVDAVVKWATRNEVNLLENLPRIKKAGANFMTDVVDDTISVLAETESKLGMVPEEQIIATELMVAGDRSLMAEEVYGDPVDVRILEGEAEKEACGKTSGLKEPDWSNASYFHVGTPVYFGGGNKVKELIHAGYDFAQAVSVASDGAERNTEYMEKQAKAGRMPIPRKYDSVKAKALRALVENAAEELPESVNQVDILTYRKLVSDIGEESREVSAGEVVEKELGKKSAIRAARVAAIAEQDGRMFLAGLCYKQVKALVEKGKMAETERMGTAWFKPFKNMVAVDQMEIEAAAKEGALVGLTGSALADFVAEKTGLQKASVAVVANRWEKTQREATKDLTAVEKGIIREQVLEGVLAGKSRNQVIEDATTESKRCFEGLSEKQVRKAVKRMAELGKPEQALEAEDILGGPLQDEEVRTGASNEQLKRWKAAEKKYNGELLQMPKEALRKNLGKKSVRLNTIYRIKGNGSKGLIVLGATPEGVAVLLVNTSGE